MSLRKPRVSMTAAVPTVTLRGGARMPALAWGTGTSWFNRAPSEDLDASAIPELQASVVEALRAGVRHLDAAEMCGSRRRSHCTRCAARRRSYCTARAALRCARFAQPVGAA